ncbi:MAG: ABC transporter ATP-binding protein [Gemmatimonadaceae bacterium]|nr:ABC transporter ATP-binding protein [Gemmatimonadaceae bacterium]
MTTPFFEVRALSVSATSATLVAPVDFAIAPGRSLALVGPSGAGKSTIARAILDLLPRGLTRRGSVWLDGVAIHDGSGPWRARRIGALFQDPTTALDPLMRIGAQIAEVVRAGGERDHRRAARIAIDALAELGIDAPDARARQYPHELSGGQRQRAALARALVLRPALLIADEPTSALDVTTQAQFLAALDRRRGTDGLAVLLVSHDLAVVAAHAEEVLVLAQGAVVERGRTTDVLRSPQHAITRALCALHAPSAPRAPHHPSDGAPIIATQRLTKHFPVAAGWRTTHTALHAVDDVTLSVHPGEVLAIVGESGCGKSTFARLLPRLLEPTAGAIHSGARDVRALNGPALRRWRASTQLLLQESAASLDPMRTLDDAIREGLRLHAADAPHTHDARVRAAADAVGLGRALLDRPPAQCSMGERQRAALARALVVDPDVLILDEPTASLDAVAADHLLAQLAAIQCARTLTLIVITHDLGIVRRLATQIAVMYLGRVVEHGPAAEVLATPAHPYTRALLDAVPGAAGVPIAGDVPSPLAPPSGCVFHPRCTRPDRNDDCTRRIPPLLDIAPARRAACWRAAPALPETLA